MSHKVVDPTVPAESPKRDSPNGDPHPDTPLLRAERRYHALQRESAVQRHIHERTITDLRAQLATATRTGQHVRQLLHRHRWTCCTAFVTLQIKASYTLATTPTGDVAWIVNLGQVLGLFGAAGYLLWPYAKRLGRIVDPAADIPTQL